MKQSSAVHPKRKLSEHFVNSDTEEDSQERPPAKRKISPQNETQTSTTFYARDKQIRWNPSTDCLCKILGPVPYFDRSSPALGDGVRRLIEASSKCPEHTSCCPRCQPSCHTQRSLEPALQRPPGLVLEDLHPVPQNWLRRNPDYFVGKKDQRIYEEQAWRIHSALLGKLEVNPYRQCVCDLVGLGSKIQVVKDPVSQIAYAHQMWKCLAYPRGNWKEGLPRPQQSSMHKALLPTIEAFRRTARSKKGIKNYGRTELLELERQCGLHYRPTLDTACRRCIAELRHMDNANIESVKVLICACCEQCGHKCNCDNPALNDQEESGPNSSKKPKVPSRIERKNEVRRGTNQTPSVRSFSNTEEADEHMEKLLPADMIPLRPTKENASRRRSEHALGSKRKRRGEVDFEQENWPTSYDPSNIAEDILRAAGIHPTLPPLNAHMKHASELGELVKTRKGRKSRKTA